MTMKQRVDQIKGYASMVQHRLDQGWNGTLLTLMFGKLNGNQITINDQMRKAVEQVYASVLTRFVRRPKSYGSINPVMIACADGPVNKREKKSLYDVITNDGLHWHALLLGPPVSRLKTSAEQHFIDNQHHYVQDQRLLNRVHAEEFYSADVDRVTEYALKGLKTNRLSFDDSLLILPTASREPSNRKLLITG